MLRSVIWLTSDTNWDILQGREKEKCANAMYVPRDIARTRLDRERVLLDLGSDTCETG